MIDVPVVLLGILIGLAFGLFVYFIYFWFNYREKQKELDQLLSIVLKDAMAAEKAPKIVDGIEFENFEKDSAALSNAGYLTTLITVIIKKFNGEVVLTANDFQDINLDDDYVTMYVDTGTYDIILRSNNSDISSYMGISQDEDIFH
jgi:hypothetical protein